MAAESRAKPLQADSNHGQHPAKLHHRPKRCRHAFCHTCADQWLKQEDNGGNEKVRQARPVHFAAFGRQKPPLADVIPAPLAR
ncbi:hypothetical protein D1224_06470 [Henriciella barbarensis]|uniref:Zinc finger C3HC4 RING-type domain-containing protein n=1 Tax=Henriciella barbarensis TaxID=86342 RepID=A0A399R1T7_9PROT|nr:hypothetical protein D1224_06470 [Henriciella barbarensis]